MKFRKLTSLLTACAMLCTAAAVLPEMPETMSITASAEETAEYTEGTYELLTYRNFEDYIEISDCDDTATEVVIPSEMDGVKLTSIGGAAFYYCTSLSSVTIPDGVTSIGNYAFGKCTSLTEITIPDSVTSIGDCAFRECTSLTEITIPDSVTSIGDSAFYGCDNLMEITIENPNCELYDSEDTISSTATIYGYEGSTAQTYAETYGYAFESLGEAPAPEISLADLNDDSAIDATDASALLIAAANAGSGAESGLTAEQEAAADLNGDGAFDASDASLILMYAAYTGSGGTMTIEEFLANS